MLPVELHSPYLIKVGQKQETQEIGLYNPPWSKNTYTSVKQPLTLIEPKLTKYFTSGQSPTNHEKRRHSNPKPQNLNQTQESPKGPAIGFKLSFLGSLRSPMGWSIRNAWWISPGFPRSRRSRHGTSSLSRSRHGVKLCESSRPATATHGPWIRGSISISTSSRRFIPLVPYIGQFTTSCI